MTSEIDLLSLDEFEKQLGELIEVSARNGIRFDRSWTFRRPNGDTPDVMVEITRLRDSPDDS
ncbi:hypothetical protein [Haladaptatus caseinilyticus]|uniref:hypothetical protein n=1 Tax=Haladaptatus caseinilyticus TaxID=2993314 RepID=UPI00224AFD0B|nr:hypothetical protein [Haladaptatus caseinilyticus]